MPTQPRLAFLENLVNEGKADSFARYALALEYDRLARSSESLAAFEALRRDDPSYLPMYLMAAKLLRRLDQGQRATEWVHAGIALAESTGNGHAKSELLDFLEELSAS
ncbi:MAG TPA: tetratricopeptide repeat protein [Polyangiaceae bacterium]|nr:tetratricopeptide repeat protein [Polyangiaceae bacterium]